MSESTHPTIHRTDYTSPNYLVDTVDLRFELGEETTLVTARLAMRANHNPTAGPGPLVLDGRRLVLKSLSLDGSPLLPDRYLLTADGLTVPVVADAFTLEIVTELRPQENTFLEGLYRSAGMFCTQCEAEGFRTITFYPDRPDVLAVFTTTIEADSDRYPVLLSNGNLTGSGTLPGNRHFATWHDPFPKPSYLFALVAGDLASCEGQFTTCSGREVALRLYVHPQNLHKCDHPLRSLQKAMRWDEETFGREYDLDIYMIVAVDDFNMGAMENKGLNIFNSRYVLASPETATDDDYQAIEEVIGHEYFHNWSGNRVTCRDWFQLSLKEGLTIFRDQEFTADMESRGVKRINDVRYLRTIQFAEDSGPLAHPVRPDSYMEINNFYTATVYNKGAEIIRMLRTLLGPERFRQGMDLYFARYDGHAATVYDFVAAMAEAGGIDLGQFDRWYSQAGTPQLTASASFEPANGSYTLVVRQSTPATPGQPLKEPLHIPLAMGLLSHSGEECAVTLAGEPQPGPTTRVLELRRAEETFRFTGLAGEPVPALLRTFSAPVRLAYPYRHAELVLLMSHETDPFCRWEAGQQLAARVLLGLVDDWRQGREFTLDPDFVAAFEAVLTGRTGDRAFQAEALTLPTEAYLAEMLTEIEPTAIHAARQFVRRTLAASLRGEFLAVRAACRPKGPYRPDDGLSGQRRLANLCLGYLAPLEEHSFIDLCVEQYRTADNMTDAMGALIPLASCNCPERELLLAEFYDRWQADRQVVDKWFSLQATAILPDTLPRLTTLLNHPAFELHNPNRFRALVGAFSQGNQVRFHAPDGAGYRFLTDQLLQLIPVNPQVAARLLAPLTRWRRFDANRQQLMKIELERIRSMKDLPRDVYEVVTKSLAE
ncbi:aminopeptidase N [Geobacter argillaceus]|uniref:Aminopeptidase N n=1 Tax=Geobacter argillaceus TaxID=345631 RepID=A0A562VPV8_9BACT|nr:aminopeptidase N [Geobacter argillaceus]TWJ19774.1 aminopeptidase N [Geobacter argillaceus]